MPQYNYKLQDAESLMEYAKDLKREAQRLELIIEGLVSDGIGNLETRNNTIGVRGLGYIQKFVDAVREKHLEIKREGGYYDAENRKRRSAKTKK